MAISVVLCVAAGSGPARAEYVPLPRAAVQMDGQPVDIAPLVQDAEATLVPLGKAIGVLTRGRASADKDDANPYRVRSGDKVLLEISYSDEGAAVASVGGRRIPLADGPQRVALAGQPERLMMDIRVLAGLLGITTEQNGATFSLFTPDYWGEKLGLDAARGSDLVLRPDLGISPPAKSLLIWVRPREPVYLQLYKLSGDKPEPLLGENQFGKRVTHPNPPVGEPRAWTAEANKPVRLDTRFYDAAPEPDSDRYASYVVLLSRKQPRTGDIVAAIKSGEIGAGDWCVVGIRQRLARSVILYDVYTTAAGDTLETVAERYHMPLAMLEDLNGLTVADPLAAGERLAVIGGIDVAEQQRRQEERYTETGYYEVRPGDTVESLAKRCGVAVADFLDANSAVPPGAALSPGDVVTLVKPVKQVVTPTPTPEPVLLPDVQPDFAVKVVKAPVSLRQYSLMTAPAVLKLRAGQAVTILAKVPERDQCRVAVGDTIGWVRLSDIGDPPKETPRPQPPAPAMLASGDRIVREALKYVGVPRYEWGGNRIDRGIDCSHFVAAAYSLAQQKVPSPPVHNMEIHGSIVDWKQGPIEEYGRVRNWPSGPNLSRLRPGDRIIFQNNPTSARSGNHHTGIYVGPYRKMKHAVVHCNSGANTVSVNELTGGLWRIYRYAVRGSQKRPAGTVAEVDVTPFVVPSASLLPLGGEDYALAPSSPTPSPAAGEGESGGGSGCRSAQARRTTRREAADGNVTRLPLSRSGGGGRGGGGLTTTQEASAK